MMEDKITIKKLNLYYSDFHALHDINVHIQRTKSLPSSARQAAGNHLFCDHLTE